MLGITVHEGEFLFVNGTAILTFQRVKGRKVAVLVDGPGRCLREKALKKMLPSQRYEQLIARVRGSQAKTAKPRSSPR
jgi:hypothetical protein